MRKASTTTASVFVGMGAANRTVSFSLASNGAKSAVIGSLSQSQRSYSTSPSPAAAPLHSSPPPANAAPKPEEEEEVTHFGFKNVRANEKASMVGEVFHRVASNYDLMNDVMSAGVHRCPANPLPRILLEFVESRFYAHI